MISLSAGGGILLYDEQILGNTENEWAGTRLGRRCVNRGPDTLSIELHCDHVAQRESKVTPFTAMVTGGVGAAQGRCRGLEEEGRNSGGQITGNKNMQLCEASALIRGQSSVGTFTYCNIPQFKLTISSLPQTLALYTPTKAPLTSNTTSDEQKTIIQPSGDVQQQTYNVDKGRYSSRILSVGALGRVAGRTCRWRRDVAANHQV